MNYYSLNPSILLSPIEDGYIAFDTRANLLHELNPVAALLAELSDGTRTVSEIVELVQSALPKVSASSIENWFQEATEKALILESPQPLVGGHPNELTAEKLCELAIDLQNQGMVQAAYLCQKQAVEQEPGSSEYLRYLGEISHITGKRESARKAYEDYLKMEPEDAEIKHLLTSLRDQTAPDRVPNECIEQLYERFSGFYDSNMRDELGYSGPEQMKRLLSEWLGTRNDLSTLDLGCGTGLSGEMIRPHSSLLFGIDLSREMVSLAKERAVYDHLEVAEITEFVSRSNQTFDLILSCDAFIYFGDLRQILEPGINRLNPNGAIAFSVEKSADHGFHLTDSGRYVHSTRHIEALAEEFSMNVEMKEAFLRMEYGKEVTGIFALLTPA